MQNKFLVKIIAMMCAASAIAATTPALVSADPNKNINPKIAENIIDQNSQNEEDNERNKARKLVNDTFIDEILYQYDPIEDMSRSMIKLKHILSKFAQNNLTNPFDQFMYVNIASVHIRANSRIRPGDPYYRYFCEIAGYEIEKKTNFNFLSTKMKISNMLIDQEKDLIKQLILKLISRDFLEIKDPINLSGECYDPYDVKEVMERLYCKFLKEYHKDDNLEYDVFADNLKIKQEAYEAALEDAGSEHEHDLNEKDEVFKKIYYETYARANAEMDVRLGEKRQYKKIKDKNLQEMYDNAYNDQYNEVAKQRGFHDFIEPNSRYTYKNDPSASASYDKGYVMGVREKARKDARHFKTEHKFNKNLYEWQDVKNGYSAYFSEALREIGSITFKEPRLEDQHLKKSDWQEFLDNNNDDQDMAEFKKEAQKNYREGCVEGCRERGLRYAHSEEYRKKFYRFDGLITKDLLEEDDLYNQCKQAYDDGIKQGLNDLNLKNVKK